MGQSQPSGPRRRGIPIRAALAGLLAGAAGGALASLAGIPLPWLIGALLGTAALRLVRIHAAVPEIVRKAGQLVVGVAIGLYFTPEVAAQVLWNGPLLVVGSVVLIAAGGLTGLLLARYAGIDPQTGWFASLPGGVSEMAVLAQRNGGDAALVALAQSLRVICVVIVVPTVITLLYGGSSASTAAPLQMPVRVVALALMGGAGLMAALVFDRLRLPNAYLFGGLAIGMAVAVFEVEASRVPDPLVNLAQLLIGSTLGCRFHQGGRWPGRRFVAGTVATTLLLIAIGWGLAALLAPALEIDIPTGVLGAAPGGVAEMSITAKVLHFSVPLVTAWHLVRIVLVTSLGILFFRAISRLSRDRGIR
ncbi:AbrB family transcriptional regulator [Azospirillum thermophilum]|uniref:AbrB family transcriptional regulator n=1 Tax=Azospirillum thermophilum TaxID=2202148 RepID=A0A2S2CLZ1_9PROT|nr:AbrB family transcriptional regulator [Azospirillum thermophilum]AWK85390.1 hypothetical protein DEW08_03655 [Azospirillum thermophilum]